MTTPPPMVRSTYLDVLRVAAAFAVVLLHCADHLPSIQRSANPVMGVATASLLWCIPVFVMVSGACILDPSRHESWVQFTRKRSSRVGLPLLFWSILFLLLRHLEWPLSRGDVVLSVAIGKPSFHMWFLYMILGLYLFAVPLRTYIRCAPKAEQRALALALLLLGCAFSQLERWRDYREATILTSFLPYLGLFMCGRYVANINIRRLRLAALVPFTLLTVPLAIGYVRLMPPRTGLPTVPMMGYLSPPSIAMAISVFLLFRKVGTLRTGDLSVKWRQRAAQLAATTLGVYLVHPLLIVPLARALSALGIPMTGTLLASTVLALATFTLATAGVAIIQKIPVVRRVV